MKHPSARIINKRKAQDDTCSGSAAGPDESLIVRASREIVTRRTVSWFWWYRQTSPPEPELRELNRLVDALLSTYKNYFNDLVERESWSETSCLGQFKKIAEEVLNEEVESYNWTRIAMLLALACRMAQHCYGHGATTCFVRRFSLAVGLCIQERISAWLQGDHQWANLRQRERSVPPAGSSLMQVFGVGTAVVSAVVTVMNLTQSSSAIATFLKR